MHSSPQRHYVDRTDYIRPSFQTYRAVFAGRSRWRSHLHERPGGAGSRQRKLIEGDVSAQTEQILQNLTTILSEANKSLGDVVKVGVYLTDMKRFAEMNEVYARHFVAPYPARTTVAVVGLPLGAAVEIEVIAR